MPNKIRNKSHKIIILGTNHAGKTQVFRALKGEKYQHIYKQTLGIDLSSIDITQEIRLNLFDTLNSEFEKVWLSEPELILYCIDLKTIADKKECELQKISEVMRNYQKTPIILVGTKSDEVTPLSTAVDELCDIIKNLNNDFVNVYIATTARNKLGFTPNKPCESNAPKTLCDYIKEMLPKVAPADSIMFQGYGLGVPVDGPTKDLIKALNAESSLTTNQRNEIEKLTFALTRSKNKDSATIEQFVNECQTVLDGEHPNVMKAVYSVATAAIVTGVIIGLAVAFGAPLCLALLASAASFGAVASGLSLYTMFRISAKNEKILTEYAKGSGLAP
jgi:GTPase SAR1 family protein